jgi:signal transduction histidine kinase
MFLRRNLSPFLPTHFLRRTNARRFALAISLLLGLYEAPPTQAADGSTHLVTSVAQFRKLSPADFLSRCDFQLSGVVTLVDTNRNLIVLQDSTGAVALNAPIQSDIAVEEFASIAGSNCAPLYWRFPDFPHRPASQQIRAAFEAPLNGGDYYLARMRGWLRPPTTGDYKFWIASDNSSDLWLSSGADAANVKKIACVPRYAWVAPREWSKFPAQQSESIWLEAGKSYYIEAFQEQTHGDANFAVAWQGPGITQSVIDGAHLIPPGKFTQSSTNGILLERWTNYTAGSVGELGEPRPFQSALSIEELRISDRRAAQLPRPRGISFDPKWIEENNYCWVEIEAMVTFAGEDGEQALLTLPDGKSQLQARALHGTPLSRLARNTAVRVQGVCEGIYDENGALTPGVIWITSDSAVSKIEVEATFAASLSSEYQKNQANQPPALGAFYGARGVVTFNDRVFDTDCLFIQQGDAPVFVRICGFKNQLKVGDWIDLGGSLEPGRFFPTVNPMVVASLGVRTMPEPSIEPIEFPIPRNRDGKWTEIEGVGHAVKTNGVLSLAIGNNSLDIWIGATTAEQMRKYVDANIRAHGVLSATALEMPLLLVPSRRFVEVEKAAPEEPFATPLILIANAKQIVSQASPFHRVHVAGEVTLQDGASFFLQDASGGIRVRPFTDTIPKIGESLEVVAFPGADELPAILTEAAVRAGNVIHPAPALLDLTEALPIRQNGSLVALRATLLARRTIGKSQILDLQEGRRVLTATLATNLGLFPTLAPGSRLEVTGVCVIDNATPVGITSREKAALASITVWLRSPGDVRILSGPPWWTWRRAGALISTLLAILGGALVWVHLLRRRLQRQKAAQLAASQQVLKRLEEERRRIAANLHDSLGQALLLIKNQSLVALQRTANEATVRDRLSEISGATSQALEDVRQITHGLRPYQLDRLGLTQALRATVTRASADSAIVFASRFDDIDTAFDKDSEIHLYRVVQEGISNILKHSAATEATVVVKKKNGHVSLSIRDNGCGFDVTGMSASSNDLGYGLSGIAERVRILGGELTIDSRPGLGANLSIEIPIHHHAESNHHSDRG